MVEIKINPKLSKIRRHARNMSEVRLMELVSVDLTTWRYYGDIEMHIDDTFLWIKATTVSGYSDCLVVDAFWIGEVVSIIGHNEQTHIL